MLYGRMHDEKLIFFTKAFKQNLSHFSQKSVSKRVCNASWIVNLAVCILNRQRARQKYSFNLNVHGDSAAKEWVIVLFLESFREVTETK